MTPPIYSTDEERREAARRSTDAVRYWLPIVLSLLTTVLALGIVYGQLDGQLELIRYRLGQIELTIGRRP